MADTASLSPEHFASKDAVGYLNVIDKKFEAVDVTDDYYSCLDRSFSPEIAKHGSR